MDTILINTKNSEAKKTHLFKSQLPGKIDLRTQPKDVSLSNLSITSHGKHQDIQKWNEEFKVSDGLYLLHHIHNYFQYIKENYE